MMRVALDSSIFPCSSEMLVFGNEYPCGVFFVLHDMRFSVVPRFP